MTQWHPSDSSHGRGLVIIALTVALAASPSAGQEPLCGLQAVYAAALLLDLDPSFSDLLRPEFVGSDEGSSLAELEKAASSIALHSVSLGNLTTNDLMWSRWPIILHVKTDVASSKFNHFVLFGGVRNGTAIIHDGISPAMQWTLAELASRWDGNALVLSKAPINAAAVTSASRLYFAGWIAAIACSLWLAVTVRSRVAARGHGVFATSVREAAALCLVAGGGAWAFHVTSPEGFITAPEGVNTVWGANASSFLPRISLKTARELQRTGAAVFVDARSAKDYESDHVPSALNLPSVTPEPQAIAIAKALPSDRRLVVYCSNALCSFSYTTSQRLLQAGHKDVVIFAGGWKEWQSQTNQTSTID